jgi:hypothetical protein
VLLVEGGSDAGLGRELDIEELIARANAGHAER